MSKTMKLSNNPWIKQQCDHITINDTNYFFRCNYAFNSKMPNCDYVGIHLEIVVFKQISDDEIEVVEWKDYKGSYLAEKLSDYVKNTLNGQRRIYWDNTKERKFD